MPRRKKRSGIGATVLRNTRRLHPSALVMNRAPGVQIPLNHVTFELKIVRLEEKNFRRKLQMCYVLRHTKYVGDDGETALELYAVKSKCKLLEEEPPEIFFGIDELLLAENHEEVPPAEVPNEVLNFNVQENDVAILIANGVETDNDNEPLPENEPFNENPWALERCFRCLRY